LRSQRRSATHPWPTLWHARARLARCDLGGGIIKQRVARPGKGKSGGYRTVIAYRARNRAVFLFGFAKSERDTSAMSSSPT